MATRQAFGAFAHSDQGSQYTSEDFQRLLSAEGITCSMSKRGDCWDNSAVESFFASPQKGTCLSQDVRHARSRARRHLRLHRSVLQFPAPTFDAWAGQPDGVRTYSCGLSVVSGEAGEFHK
ncbi:MAG: DDE-type integrase/transposase/recombinase [Betaproteobacteria bacterium]|nr:DDE-type integrase/transposase/recombinase [Betaproteobacteria bacterium]